MKQLEGFDQGAQILAACDSQTVEQCIMQCFRSGQRPGMGHGDFFSFFTLPNLDQDDRFLANSGLLYSLHKL